MTTTEKAGQTPGQPSAQAEMDLDSRPGIWSRFLQMVLRHRETSILIAGIVLVIYFQVTTPVFLSSANIVNLIQFSGTTAIIAAGEVFVLVVGELDLSVGMVYAMTPFVLYFANQAGLPWELSLIVALAVAAAVGLINGVLTTVLRLPAFVTTLGTMFLINGFTLTLSGGFPVQPTAGPVFTQVFGNSAWAEMAWATGIAIVLQLVLNKTRWGLHTIATGGNLIGAAEVGIKTRWIKTGNFMICAVLGGFAGVIDAMRIGSIDPLAGGSQIMFSAIAAAVIGGTLLTGGSGTIIGALIGAFVLGILKDGFTLSGVSAYTFDMILGGAILATMAINVRLSMWRDQGGG